MKLQFPIQKSNLPIIVSIVTMLMNNTKAATISSTDTSLNAQTSVTSAINIPIALAQNYHEKYAPKDYLISEKLDGVRAYWDGAQLHFKSGRVINAPAWFTTGFPSYPIDGELWMGRGRFDATSAAARRQSPNDAEWKTMTYQVFELPQEAGSFEERYSVMKNRLGKLGKAWLQVISQTRLTTPTELQDKLTEIVNSGGEGLILHRADSTFQTGRAETLLKLKPQLDAEAVIVAHELGKGKYRGMLGALVLMTSSGQCFKLGTGLSDENRRTPPAIGKIVTYRYRDLTSTGLPKFASFLRVRELE